MSYSFSNFLAACLFGLIGLSCVANGLAQHEELPQPPALTSRVLSPATVIERVAFASCYVPQFEQPGVWEIIAKRGPDLLILMGDNVYQAEEKAEPELRELREAYMQLSGESEFAELRAMAATFATWDDHDYGRNDAGADLPVRYQSEDLFEHVWPLPQETDDPRLGRDGIYHAAIFGPVGKRVQLLMLDTRFFRGPLGNPSSTMLGEAQWNWLAEELHKPAELRLLVSSIPVLSQREDAENWSRLISEQARLLRLLKGSNDVLILSGDSHYAALYRDSDSPDNGLTEFTSSSLNFPYPHERQAEVLKPDRHRLGGPFFDGNFGWLELDWASRQVAVSIYSTEGKLALQETIKFAGLPSESRAQPGERDN
jgi:alkaline phosphatase D